MTVTDKIYSYFERKRLDSLQKQLEECSEYPDRLAEVAKQAIGFDLDDGVLHNYVLLRRHPHQD